MNEPLDFIFLCSSCDLSHLNFVFFSYLMLDTYVLFLIFHWFIFDFKLFSMLKIEL
jgi:hypothetical protein